MPNSLPNSAGSAHPVFPDLGRKHMAKADVREPDVDWRARLAAAAQRAVLQVWETNKLAAAALGVDDAEFGKWMSGSRRAQWDLLFAHETLRPILSVELARAAGADVHVHVEFRKVG